jgi:transaldolase/glucose-6-phosphate isomerase
MTEASFMSSNPLKELLKAGQSVWYDQMQRSLLTTGELKRMIKEDGLRGLTSNPTIFEKAIAGSSDYDDALRGLAFQRKSAEEIYDALVIDDLSKAADAFRPVYDEVHGEDGFVSLEVSPRLAHDTQHTIEDALRYFKAMSRPNLMIKVPATPEGIPAIEELIAAGVNVNITLIFSRDVYAKVIDAYLKGLERRVDKGEPVGHIASVASFFVSRIDAKADKEIKERIKGSSDEKEKEKLQGLLGKVAIANAKLAYELFKQEFNSPRFLRLRDAGAMVQRPLWASTGTKDPAYSDVLYIDELIGPDTVNTIPPSTYLAFKDHGRVTMSLERDLDEAKRVLADFAAFGFSLDAITEELTRDGVDSFEKSFDSLIGTIESRRDVVTRGITGADSANLGSYEEAVHQTLDRMKNEKFVERIWKKDTTLWKNDDAHKKIISNALGWLGVAEWVKRQAADLVGFANEIRRDFDYVVVLGMGGSSLCSEVLKAAFGHSDAFPELLVLDSTVPAAVERLEGHIDLERTLFIVASKSGTTTEPRMFYRYFFERVRAVRGDKAGGNFIAITDPGTQMEDEAKKDRFRRIFLNPPDIGGRYSALSLFGMVPAALAGVDVDTLLDRAIHAMHACSPSVVPADNPGAFLGAVMGTLALKGRDKLTIVSSNPLSALGLWIEQLIAESTGKEGKGILPVNAESLLDPSFYGNDRLFVWIRTADSEDAQTSHQIDALERAGHPVLQHILTDPLDLGDEFFIWEFATAVAGALLGIDAFDQPNVQESKDNTKALLEAYRSSGSIPQPRALATEGSLTVSGDGVAGNSVTEVLASLFSTVKPGDYVAITQYIEETASTSDAIQKIREEILRALHVATTTGFGPRFLHSTGQLHKGGSDKGVFIQITKKDERDLPLPGEPFGFSVLKDAQSAGDFQSLQSRNRRAVTINIGTDVSVGLASLLAAVQKSLASKSAART